MLKIKRIKLSGFRGILTPQELKLCDSGGTPTSLAVYGLNSSGKSSFVDGLEWFLSETSEIEWLRREDAKSNAYPHQEAVDGESYVEIDFINEKKAILPLTKTYDHMRVTIPKLSSVSDFEATYRSFVIRPYLRYLEIIDFVFNSTGLQKYQRLANWMGFEYELAFQEKIALKILPELNKYEKSIESEVTVHIKSLKALTQLAEINESKVLNLCKGILASYTTTSFISMAEIENRSSEIDKLRSSSGTVDKLSTLSRYDLNIDAVILNEKMSESISSVQKEIDSFTKKKELVEKIDYITLYERASDILDKDQSESTFCPLCKHPWRREDLIAHVKGELVLLQEVKVAQDKVLDDISALKLHLKTESTAVSQLCNSYKELKKSLELIKYEKTEQYLNDIEKIRTALDGGGSIFTLDIGSVLEKDILEKVIEERIAVKVLIYQEKTKVQPSNEEIKRNTDIERVKKINDLWIQYKDSVNELNFYKQERDKFVDIASDISTKIQESIVKRFKTISSLIGKYFGILRSDKDIKDIEITLNQDKGKAAGRSAEIQLSYYDISVKPAYKVLSESLLNSLGLAVYFACIKQFNTESKFIVLDDIMNSLDTGHRDTLLDLIELEFDDYQVVLFTHDLHWFEKIQRRFPKWTHKKIKSWDYKTGPKIDSSTTTRDDVKELLKDSTKAQEAGSKLGIYVEGILNELCEDLHAEMRYRFTRNDPPTMEELFIALHKRLADKLNKHSVVELVKNAQKYEPIMRNATSHPRQNYSSSISPAEVQRALDEWEKVELELFCATCNKYVQYKRENHQIECRCGKLKLRRVSN